VKPLPEDVADFFKSPSDADQPIILDDSDVLLLSSDESGRMQFSGNFIIYYVNILIIFTML